MSCLKWVQPEIFNWTHEFKVETTNFEQIQMHHRLTHAQDSPYHLFVFAHLFVSIRVCSEREPFGIVIFHSHTSDLGTKDGF